MSIDPFLALSGLVVGTLVGLTGMGGAALMAPLLMFLGFRPLVVVGTDLAYSAITKLVGGAQHLRHGTVDLRIVRQLAIGSLPGALLGVAILKQLQGAEIDGLIRHALGAALVLVAGTLIVRVVRPDIRLPAVPPWLLSLSGFVVGVLVGITSVGSGSLIAALLAVGTPLPSRKIVGTDLVHGFLLVALAAVAHWGIGSIDLLLTANLLLGAIPGVLLGSRLSARLPERALRSTLAVMLFAIGFQML